jgi:hypothetical protein
VGIFSSYIILVKSVALIVALFDKQLIGTVKLLHYFIALLLAHYPIGVIHKSLQSIGALTILKRCCISQAQKSPSSLYLA